MASSSDAVRLTLTASTASDVDVYWLGAGDGDGEERFYMRVPAGETRTQETFAGHVWRCRVAAAECGGAGGEVLATITLGSDAQLSVGRGGSPASTAPRGVSVVDQCEAFYDQRLEVGLGGLAVRAHACVSAAAQGRSLARALDELPDSRREPN